MGAVVVNVSCLILNRDDDLKIVHGKKSFTAVDMHDRKLVPKCQILRRIGEWVSCCKCSWFSIWKLREWRNENGVIGPIGKADWKAEDGICNEETSVRTNLKSNFNGRQFQLEVESEPPNIRAKNNLLGDLTTIDHKKATEKVLYKTGLCYQFRAGFCPFIENCDFAHSKEELRELPHNWQEIVSAHKEEEIESSELPREVFQRPIMGLNEEIQGSNQRLQCKGFLTRFGCQFGENCIFIHNEHYEERKSAAICLHPGSGGGCESNRSKWSLNASN